MSECVHRGQAFAMSIFSNPSFEHMRRLYAGHDLLHLLQVERIRKSLRFSDAASSFRK